MAILSKESQARIWKDLKGKPNVVGYSASPKSRIENGKEVTDTKVIRVYVSSKKDHSSLSANDLVPRYIQNGRDTYETDVIEIGEIKALSCCGPDEDEIDASTDISDGRRDRHRPLVIGPSAMGVWEGATACTLGGFAKNKKPGEPEFIGILANNHCGAQENKAPIGNPYIQQSPMDGGSMPDDLVARLWRKVDLIFNGYDCPYRNAVKRVWRRVFPAQTMSNTVDIAFMKLEDLIEYNVEVHTVGAMSGKRDAVEGDIVAKFGRTTGLTTGGRVLDTDWVGAVTYSRGRITFSDCVLVSGIKFSQGGDSSSFTYTETDKMYIGNLFAGSDTTSIICKGKNVEADLQVEVLI